MSKDAEEKIGQLQMMEQNIHNILLQKQQFQSQLIEVESALKELGKTEKAYKIVGNIMISASKEDLEKDLNSKKEMAELRIKALEKQENKMREKQKAIQEEVMKQIKK